jgi:glyoxylase-like metal-dependent hydrolase (beta-lactamase superfamily II)
MYFGQLLNDATACASYLFGCKSRRAFAVVDPHIDLVEDYLELAEREGMPIVAVFETHLQADHVSGLPELVARTGANAYLPERAGVEFAHHAPADGEVVEYSGSGCGRGLSANPISTIGFERRHNRSLQFADEDAFAGALVEDMPPAPERQGEIVAANRAGRPLSPSR